jgi:hypothetical protein
MQGCGLSIQEDLLNKYADDMVKYCMTSVDNSVQDTPASSISILDKKEQEVVHLESIIDSLCLELFVYMEKHIAHKTSDVKRLHEQECKYRKYVILFWFMSIIYVGRILITT